MIKHRNLFVGFLLTVITFGIYVMYWFWKTKRELVEMGGKIPTTWLLFIPIANLYWLYMYYVAFSKVVKNDDHGIMYFILHIFVFPLMPIIVQLSLNEKASSGGNSIPVSSIPSTPTPVQVPVETLPVNEINSKNYIEQYKSQYSRDSIKTALINSGQKPDEVETYLQKYF